MLGLSLTAGQAQYKTSWVGNTYGDNAHHVGNAARSCWVSPGGIVYTASIWDENGRNIGIYQNGVVLGGMGGTKESQGSAITGDSSWVFTAQQAKAGTIGRYSRVTMRRDLVFAGSTVAGGGGRPVGGGDCIRGLAVFNGRLYVSDFGGNRIAVFTTGGTFVRTWNMQEPGALAVDSGGFVWVAREEDATIVRFDSTGRPCGEFRMQPGSRPSALYADRRRGQLWVGDQGPDMNIKIWNLKGEPKGSFGMTGGYLNPAGGLRGQMGDKRFTRVVGIGRDDRGCIYVLNNPWGGSWDLGRNGATDLHCYDSTGVQLWTLQALNFEGGAAADPGTDGTDGAEGADGTDLYSGNMIYHFTGKGGGDAWANTIDPFRYPQDARIQAGDKGRGEHFGMLAHIRGHRILVACGQNPDVFYTYYFNAATDGFIAIPGDTIQPPVRNGFQLDAAGGIWIGSGKPAVIKHYPLTGFASNGKPVWGPVVLTPAPVSIAPLNRIGYLPAGDRMVLAGGSSDWTLIGNRIEVYKGWLAGNRIPNTVITLNRAQAKSLTVAGDYVFIGYYAIPTIDIFNLETGRLADSLIAGDGVYPGNDVDSEYGLQAYRRSTGEYLITKDDYNGSKVVVYTWNPGKF